MAREKKEEEEEEEQSGGKDQLLQKDMVNLIGVAVNSEMTEKKNWLLKVC